MNPMKWKTRTLAYSGISLFVIYLLIVYKWNNHLVYRATIKNSKAEYVWDYVADFRNMLKLNPTIKHFNVIDDSGNSNEWKYTVEYTEKFSHFPMFENNAQAHFTVKSKEKDYVIESKHRTCFFLGFICLNSHSEFVFKVDGQNTNCIENVQYECPLVFSSLCHKEVMYQRKEIMTNLQKQFSSSL